MNRILIIQTASLGDVILSTSLAETLHKQYPESSIDYLIKDGYQGLFQGHPFINEVLTWNKKKGKYLNLWSLAKQIRKTNYDAVINIQRFASSGFLLAFSGARFRAGFAKNPLSFTFSHRVKHVIKNELGSPHEIYRNLKLIEPLVKLQAERPKIYPSKLDEENVKQYKNNKYITISPASLYFTKQFSCEKWVELIDNISIATSVILLGGKEDIELCDKIIKSCKRGVVFNLAGQLTFLESASVMQDAIINYVNDSAPLHLTSAVNAPVAAVFCSTVPEFGFGPLADNATTIETEVKLNCKPCGLHGYQQCPEGHFKCSKTITIGQLLSPLNYGQRD